MTCLSSFEIIRSILTLIQVIEWFTEVKANLTAKYGRVIPSLAFYHIPAHAMLRYQEQGLDSRTTPGINGEKVVSQGSDDTKYTGQDSPFMQALLRTTGLMATFSGHDHDNDWYVANRDRLGICQIILDANRFRCFKWDGHLVDQNLSGNGLNMCYGRHSGYGGYGDATRGARQILLNQSTINQEVHTWVRLEDGSISAPIVLNATYGHDRYNEVVQRNVQLSAGYSMHYQSQLSLLIFLWFPVLLILCWKDR